MELRQDLRRVSMGPIALVAAFLAVVALAITGWYVLSTPQSYPGRVITTGFPGPDASDRNQQILQSREKDPELTHGH